MVRKLSIVCALALGLTVSAGSALAFASANLATPLINAQRDLHHTSFFGRPFPYGYTGWGHCIRYVKVRTPSGVHWRRVWACR